MLGVVFLPCAAFLELVFLWCAAAFSFRDNINSESVTPLYRKGCAAGGGSSKRKPAWEYNKGSHGSGEVQVKRKPNSNLEPPSETPLTEDPNDWPSINFIAPATAWIYYLDELEEEMTMSTATCVIQLYRSLWIFSVGSCLQ